MDRFEELMNEYYSLQDELAETATEMLDAYQFTSDQLEELSTLFWKWTNEGMGNDYYPHKKWFPNWLVFLIEECQDSVELRELFEPKGVEFEY